MPAMTLRPAALAILICLAAGPALSQADPLTEDLGRTLDQRSDRRLDRVEKTLREMRQMLLQGRETGQAVVVMPAGTDAQIATLAQRVADLEETLRRVNSQIDIATSDVSALRRETGQGSALNTRLEALERQVGELKAQQQLVAQAAAADPATAFDNAMRLYADGQHRAAAAAFQAFIDTHASAPEVGEARYYLGESLYAQGDFTGAASAYVGAVNGWPTTIWAPGAVIKLSQSLIEVRRNADACAVLTEFGTRYPRASAGLKAQATAARTRARCA